MFSVPFRCKICGITRSSDAVACEVAGADAIGLNFYEPSPRYVDPAAAAAIRRAAELVAVGVFVNTSTDEIHRICDQVELDYVQLHGDEPPEQMDELRDRKVIRAFRCRDLGAEPVLRYLDGAKNMPEAILLDAYEPGSYGGTGARLDWDSVRKLRDQLPQLAVILAGGLRSENVAEAIRRSEADAVDTASGVEQAPGEKDPQQVESFVRQARQAWLA